jgi:hypothetical protein
MDVSEGPSGVFTSAGFYIDLRGVSEATSAVNGLVTSGNSVAAALGSAPVNPSIFAQIGSAVGSAGSALDAHLNTGLSGVMSDLGTTNSGVEASLAAYVTLDQAIAQGYGGLQSGAAAGTTPGQSAAQPQEAAAAASGQTSGQPQAGAGFPIQQAAYHPSYSRRHPASQEQVNRWIQKACRIMQAHGVPPSQCNQEDLRIIIWSESSNDPNIVNTNDINWKLGHPSQGLMQVTPGTFQEFALPGYNSNIKDPVSNIIAGARYAIHKYHSLDSVPGVVGLRWGYPYAGY